MGIFGRQKILRHMGVNIPGDAVQLTPKIRESITSGRYEHVEADLLGKVLRDGDRLLEVGGGLGFLSALAAQSPLVEAVRVYEANSELIPLIRATHKLNNLAGIDVRCAVLTNQAQPGEAPFFIHRNFWASSTHKAHWEYERETSVPTQPLADVLREFRPTLMVCDIEGGELELFDGPELGGLDRVILELHQKAIGGRGVQSVFDSLSAAGFHYDSFASRGAVVLFRRLQDAA